MASINLVTKYAKNIDEKFTKESIIGSDYSNKFTFTGARTIEVYTPQTVDMVNYGRPNATASTQKTTKTNAFGRFGDYQEVLDEIKSYEMQKDRAFALTLDSANKEERDNVISAMSILGQQIAEKVTPEMDTYSLIKWGDGAGITMTADTGATSTNPIKYGTGDKILDIALKAMVAMDNALVPSANRILYLPATNVPDVLLDPRFIHLDKLGTQAIEKGVIGQYLGMKVKTVPDAYFKDATHTALPKFIITYKDSILRPVKIKKTRIMDEVAGIDGSVIEGRFYYDAFVLDAKKDGVLICK